MSSRVSKNFRSSKPVARACGLGQTRSPQHGCSVAREQMTSNLSRSLSVLLLLLAWLVLSADCAVKGKVRIGLLFSQTGDAQSSISTSLLLSLLPLNTCLILRRLCTSIQSICSCLHFFSTLCVRFPSLLHLQRQSVFISCCNAISVLPCK